MSPKLIVIIDGSAILVVVDASDALSRPSWGRAQCLSRTTMQHRGAELEADTADAYAVVAAIELGEWAGHEVVREDPGEAVRAQVVFDI